MAPADLLGRARDAWASRYAGPPLKLVTGFGLLLLAIRVLMRHNAVPAGTIVFGGLVGLLYAMVAFGLILVYRANRVINFAQAEMGAAPALLAVLLIKLHHVPYLVGLAVALGSALVGGFLVEVVVVRRFATAPRLVLSVATIGVSLILAIIQFYLPHWMGVKGLVNPHPPSTPFSRFHFTIKPVIFRGDAVVIFIAALAVVGGLSLFFRYTDVGIAVRASAENADRATLLGISVKRLSTIVWMIAAALSALGVFLRVPVIGLPIGADIGPAVLLYALAAAVIARMESFSVALAAGVAIGITENSIYFFSRDPNVAQAVMLPVLLVAMLVQRRSLSRGEDTGLSSFRQASEFRPMPPELRSVPEVQWAKVALALAGAAALIGVPYLVGVKQQILASVVVIYGIVAVSLVVLTGWAGQISLGQWGFAGVGAFVAGGLASHMHTDFFVTLVAAGLAGAVASLIIGLPALRIQGLYLAVTTVAFALAVQAYLLDPVYFHHYLPNNAQTIARPLLYGRYSVQGPKAFYFMCLLFLGLAVGSARAIRRSRAGRAMIAARDNSRGAQSFGVSVAGARIAAFAISGFWAALAGGLFAYHQQVVEPASFDYSISLQLLLIVVIGGVTSLPGAILGTVYIGALKYGDFSPQFQVLASGVGVLVLLIVLRGGLAGLVYGIRDGLLRTFADRRGIVVPSLLADSRLPDPKAEDEQVTDALVHAPALTSTDGHLVSDEAVVGS
jgi:ABC-type branched-subunit amino acid transport system permease subunit